MAGYCFRKPDGKIQEVWGDHRFVTSLLNGEGNLILKDKTVAIRDKDEEFTRGYAREKTELLADKAKAKAATAKPQPPAPEPEPEQEPEPEGFPHEELAKIEREELAPVAEPVEEPEEPESDEEQAF